MTRRTSAYIVMGLILVIGSACSAQAVPTATPIPPTATPMVLATATPVPPTATPLAPMATATLTEPPVPTSTDTAVPTDTVPPTPTPVVYVVKQDDSLFKIAAEFHVDVVALTEANQLTITVLSVGQKLIIPSADFATATPSPIPTGLPKGYKLQYTVLLGDTLETIAAKFNSTVDAISKANPDPTAPKNAFRHLTDQNLQAAMVIVVPVNLVTPTPTPNG